LDTPTLRHLEKYIRSTQRKKSRGKKTPAVAQANKLAQAEETERGTEQQIADVERRLAELTEQANAITQRGMARSAGSLPFEEEKKPVVGDIKEKKKGTKKPGESDSESDTDSDSDSESSGSESSESDSTSEKQAKRFKAGTEAVSIPQPSADGKQG